MSTIQVKPAPTLDRAAWPVLKHPASGGLLDAAGNVPEDGRPWLNDGFTARMLTDGAVLRADDPIFAEAEPDVAEDQKPALPEAAIPSAPPAKPTATSADTPST